MIPVLAEVGRSIRIVVEGISDIPGNERRFLECETREGVVSTTFCVTR